jgi:protein ImuB
MLWLALHFPSLSLDVFARGTVTDAPLAVAEKQRGRSRIVACNAAAQGCGVGPGMSATAAQALADDLILCHRDRAAERASLEGLALWAGRFTPSVSLVPPAGLLLEIGGCLSLHHGLANLLRQARDGLAAMACAATMACAPTAHGAWLLAKAGSEKALRDRARLEAVLAPLPLAVLEQPPAVLEGLAMIGAETLGDCLRLPRDGMARRFGPSLVDELDRALGRVPEARDFYVPPAQFARSLETPAPVHDAEALQFAVRRLLPELEGFLVRHQAGIEALELVCRHERRDPAVIRVGFARPTREPARIELMLRETLGRTRLAAPVHAITLRATAVLPLAGVNRDLFRPAGEADGEWLIERLRIRLGREAVHGLATVAEHRPERAWRPSYQGAGEGEANRHRPLWLLPRPLRCTAERLKLESGPERIESGWWDGDDIARDYYVAVDSHGARLWVYCDRASGEWYVHGVFA